MRIGIRLPSNGPSATSDGILWTAQLADRLGFSSVWVNDHVIVPEDVPRAEPYHRLYEALTTLAALSTATERVKLGTGVLLLPLREPVLLARQTAAIDAFSNGRLILGVGVGWEAGEYRLLNVEFRTRGRRCDEWLRVLRAVWRARDLDVATPVYDLTGGIAEPGPVQPGGPPVLIGGASDATYRRVAELGDGWLAPAYISMEEVADGIAKIKAQLPPGRECRLYVSRRPPPGSFADTATVDQLRRTLATLEQLGVEECTVPFPEAYTGEELTREMTLLAQHVLAR